ncbi:MAG TPA: Spy/CpxP family protein refolding chaperone [Candidatus Cloacimonadota bacterium]|nr:Spy/CpxP family protein refolding chaperone [Candidatus Cloacimonadota bacterium]
MNKLIWITLAILLLGTMLVAADKPEPVKMDAPKPMMEDCQGMGPMDMMKELGLNKTQTARLETIRNNHMKQMNSLDAEIENLQIDLQAALKADKYADAKAVQKQIFAKKLQRADARIDHMEAVMKELDPAQKDKARAMFQRMHQGMQNRGMGMGMMKAGKGMGMHNMNGCGDCGQGNMKMQDCSGMGQQHKMEQMPNHKMNSSK